VPLSKRASRKNKIKKTATKESQNPVLKLARGFSKVTMKRPTRKLVQTEKLRSVIFPKKKKISIKIARWVGVENPANVL
jgi:predicted DNA-binding transcriptional regulator AlpA